VRDEQEQDRREELEKDQVEDLEVGEDAADQVKGGGAVNKAKTADKAFKAMDDYIRG
jgi:hypothetical protein